VPFRHEKSRPEETSRFRLSGKKNKNFHVALSKCGGSNDADNFPCRIKVALPSLTWSAAFVVISLANCSLFCIGRATLFVSMKLNDEFILLAATQDL